VLTSARTFGIAHLVSISKPDSQRPVKQVAEFVAVEDFRALMPGL